MIILILGFILIKTIFVRGYYLEHDVDELTKNLFQNLRVDPILLGDAEFSEESKSFIDRQVTNYLNLIVKAEETEFSRSKRSLDGNEITGDYFIDIKPFRSIPTTSATDIVLFQQNSTWYAACLEKNVTESSPQQLKIKKLELESNTAKEVAKINVTNAVGVVAFSLSNFTIVVVPASGVTHTKIMRFSSEGTLEIIQRINTSYVRQIEIWEQEETVYMAAAQFMKESPLGTELEVDSPIYKWRGRHFDLIQFIGTRGVLKISHFSIEGVHFLAVANSETDNDQQNTYSEILKYDIETEKYRVLQKILTRRCRDLKPFGIRSEAEEEYFLAVANGPDKDKKGTSEVNRDVPSIIYKFVDNYFIPFQSLKVKHVTEWHPVTMKGGEFVLFATTTFDGIKCFHYDGWHFVEGQIEFENGMTSSGIKALVHFYEYLDKNVVVVTTENDVENTTSMFEIKISSRNHLKETYKELFGWCADMSKEIEQITNTEIIDVVPNTGNTLLSQSLEHSPEDQMDKHQSIQFLASQLNEIEEKLNKTLPNNTTFKVIEKNIKVNHLILNNDSFLKNTQTERVNDFEMDNILQNIMNTHGGFEVDSMELNSMKVENEISPQTINNLPPSTLLHRRKLENIDNLVVQGTIEFISGLNVQNINNISFNSNVLLKNEDQTFQNVTVEEIKANEVVLKKINTESIEQLLEDTSNIKKLKELKAKTVIVKGFVNEVDITTLEKYALKIDGDQEITKKYCFDELEANNLNVNVMSNKKVLEDFVVTNRGKYRLNKEAKFTKDLRVNKLKALVYLDDIPIKNGSLDILRKDSKERQYISGVKSFEYLQLLNPIQLRGKIRSKILETMNPNLIVDEDLLLEGDVRVTGDVTVKEIVKSNDVLGGTHQKGSLLRVRQRALKLTDTEIPTRLEFAKHIAVERVFADRINNIDPAGWVVNGAKQAQIIRGRKRFLGDLEITGDTRVHSMNGIDIGEFQKNVLKLNGDQVISGRHYVKTVVAEDGITSDDIKIGSQNWTSIITMKDQDMNTTPNFKNLDCNSLKTTNFNILGLINKLNITEIFEDIATLDTTFKIYSPKTFKSATIENLKVKSNYEFMNQYKSLRNHNIKLNGDIYFTNEITVNNIRFTDKCNGVPKTSFVSRDTTKNTTYIVHEPQEFKNLTVHGKVFVDSNFINDVNLTELERNTIKVDEPFDFDTVTFKKLTVNGSGVDLDGHVDHLDLDNIFQNDIDDFQSILDKKVFEDIVFIDGNARFEDTLNGFNISDVCDLITEAGQKNLVIGGNCTFAKGPHVIQCNGKDVQDLQHNLWYKDEPTIINGTTNFDNNVIFKHNVTVMGKVNGFDLNQIKADYLSKTKNQTVPAEMVFTDEVLFLQNISSPKAYLGREVNGINIDKFKGDVFLNTEQVFENTVYLETCHITNLQGEYKVNTLDLKTDVMRYDQKNMVSGHKQFKNLDVDNLIVTKNIKVQEVDVLEWIRNGVLSMGTFKITGNKQFSNITFQQGISLAGLLNGMPFTEETVMLKSLPQEISGRKTFTADEGVSFKALKIGGFVNGMDVTEMANNQVFRSGENVFKSEIHFHGNITTKNLVFNDLYRGVNVTELLTNISKLSALNNFEGNYKNLQEMSVEIEDSLMRQAYFLHYYKSVMYLPFALRAFGRKNHKGECEVIVLTYEDGLGILRFFQWNEELDTFEVRIGYSVSLGYFPSYIDQIHLGEKDYIYIEHQVDPQQNKGYRFLGKLTHFIALENTTELDNRFVQTNGTMFTTSFELPIYQQYCLIFVGHDQEIHIICINYGGEMYLLQTITEKSHQASVINIDETLYLVTIKSDTLNEGPRTNIWKFNYVTSQFELQHIIYEGDPISLTTVSYNSAHYVAVAYRHVQNTMHFGHVVIRRFDKALQEFIVWQNIYLGTPTQVDFCVLPSNELVLYILTENPTEPLIVYMYEGISGFSKKIVGSAIPNAINTNQFSINNKHFVVTQHSDHMNIIQAIFKGEKLK